MDSKADKRASPRTPARVMVLVEGRDVSHKPFREKSHTVLVNDAGALIALAAELHLNDRAKITNQASGIQLDFRVAWRSSGKINERWSYGIALIGYPDNYWGLPA